MPHVIDPQECAVCGACEAECPAGAVSLHTNSRYYVVDAALCTDCGDCVEVCPTAAVSPTSQPRAGESAP